MMILVVVLLTLYTPFAVPVLDCVIILRSFTLSRTAEQEN